MNGIPDSCSEDVTVQLNEPNSEIDTLAYLLFPRIREFYAAEENRAAFEQWHTMP